MKTSAGLVIYDKEKILLVHSGGPYWENVDSWSIPKGEMEDGEEALETALREAEEELGQKLDGIITDELGIFKQSKYKNVIAFAFKGTITLPIQSNIIEIEWPKNSKQIIKIPEVDRAEWFDPEIALTKIYNGQKQIIDKFLLIRR